MRLDPVSLQMFVSVVETGTIAGAGEREHLAASAVSKRISELEDLLDTPLLARTNKGVAPTAANVTIGGNGTGTYGATSCAARVHETITCTATYTPNNDAAGAYTETATFTSDNNYSGSTVRKRTTSPSTRRRRRQV